MALTLRATAPTTAQLGMYGSARDLPPVSSAVIVANRMFALRFVPQRDMLIVSGAFGLGTAASVDDTVDIGIYDAAAGGSRLGSSGSTAGKLNGSAGRRVINLTAPTWIRAGQPYYSCFVGALGGTSAQVGMYAMTIDKAIDLFGVGDGTALASPHLEIGFFANGSTTLPTTLPTLGSISNAPVIAWREF